MFERAAIARWFRLGHQTNPLTNQQLPTLVLTPDRPLRAAIEEYMRLRPEVAREKVDLQHAAAMAQQELLEKQGHARAQEGFRERLRSFARQLADAESLPEPAMRVVVPGLCSTAEPERQLQLTAQVGRQPLLLEPRKGSLEALGGRGSRA